MEFIVNKCTKVERETSKGEKFSVYTLNLITALRAVKVGGLTQMKRTSVFFNNATELAEGTKVNIPMNQVTVRESKSEDGNTFTWLTLNAFKDAPAPAAVNAPAKTAGATV